jgi:hypothetical protein
MLRTSLNPRTDLGSQVPESVECGTKTDQSYRKLRPVGRFSDPLETNAVTAAIADELQDKLGPTRVGAGDRSNFPYFVTPFGWSNRRGETRHLRIY